MDIGLERRQDILNRAISDYVARGYSTEAVVGAQAVMARKVRIGWFWNTVLTFVTGGLWLIVVLYRVINRRTIRVVLYVNEGGSLETRW